MALKRSLKNAQRRNNLIDIESTLFQNRKILSRTIQYSFGGLLKKPTNSKKQNFPKAQNNSKSLSSSQGKSQIKNKPSQAKKRKRANEEELEDKNLKKKRIEEKKEKSQRSEEMEGIKMKIKDAESFINGLIQFEKIKSLNELKKSWRNNIDEDIDYTLNIPNNTNKTKLPIKSKLNFLNSQEEIDANQINLLNQNNPILPKNINLKPERMKTKRSNKKRSSKPQNTSKIESPSSELKKNSTQTTNKMKANSEAISKDTMQDTVKIEKHKQTTRITEEIDLCPKIAKEKKKEQYPKHKNIYLSSTMKSTHAHMNKIMHSLKWVSKSPYSPFKTILPASQTPPKCVTPNKPTNPLSSIITPFNTLPQTTLTNTPKYTHLNTDSTHHSTPPQNNTDTNTHIFNTPNKKPTKQSPLKKSPASFKDDIADSPYVTISQDFNNVAAFSPLLHDSQLRFSEEEDDECWEGADVVEKQERNILAKQYLVPLGEPLVKDKWDLEYDKGKVKKLRKKRLFNEVSPMQKAYQRKIKRLKFKK